MIWLLTNWRLVIWGAAALAIGGAVWWVMGLRSDLAAARAEAENLSAALTIERDARAALVQERDRIVAALEAAQAAASARAARTARLREDIARAPDSDDGPVAPVLRGALDGLRHPDPAAGDHPPDDSAEPADVR
jgi:hypothetical protein